MTETNGRCPRCGYPLDDHDGLIEDKPVCPKPKVAA